MAKMGRKPIEFSEKDIKEIKQMALLGMSDEDIALIKGIAESTLKARFHVELKKSRREGTRAIRQTAFQMAISGKHPVMTIFLCKVRCKMREEDEDTDLQDRKDSKSNNITINVKDPVEAAKVYQEFMQGTQDERNSSSK